MGLFDFVKSAGEKIFGKDEPEPKAQVRDVDPAKLEQMKRTKALQNLLQKYSLEVQELKISLDGDTATVWGRCDNQAEREKVVLALGNVAGIARVDDRLEVVKPEPPAVFHTVVSGDTLSKIAKKHYGNANQYNAIFEANKPMLKSPDKIYPGQVLRIPPQPAA
jgi:nucleoid-associated protein YgaU